MAEKMSLPNIDPEFIVICQSAWCNESGFGIHYGWDGERFNNRKDAIKHGWKLRESDDFNIAQTYGDDLIWFGWMDQRIDEDEDTMRDIAESCGLTFDPRWYALEFSRASGRVIGRRAALASLDQEKPAQPVSEDNDCDDYYVPDESGYSRADEEWFFGMDGKS